MKILNRFLASSVFAAIVFLTVALLRLPSLFEPVWYADEGVYLTVGRALRSGLLLYRDIFEHKPPLIYLAAALARRPFWFHLLTAGVGLLSLALFFRLARRLSADPGRANLAALFYGVLTTVPLFEGNTTNAELYFGLFGLLGLLTVLFRESLSLLRLFLAGIFFGLGFLFKFPALFDLLSLGLFWFLFEDCSPSVKAKKFLGLGGGFLLPFLLSCVYFFYRRILRDYLLAAFIGNWDYIARWKAPSGGFLGFLGGGTLAARFFMLMLLLLVLFLIKRKLDNRRLFVILWFLVTLFGALFSGRPYPHYLLMVVPPLALILVWMLLGSGMERVFSLFLLGFLAVVFLIFKFYRYPTVGYYQNFFLWASGQRDWPAFANYFDARTLRNYRLASFIRRQTAGGERIFLAGDQPTVYALSERLPVNKYPYLYEVYDFKKAGRLLETLKEKPPQIIVTFENESRVLPGLAALLSETYRAVGSLDGAEIYRRRRD